jgi:hypothetical protein
MKRLFFFSTLFIGIFLGPTLNPTFAIEVTRTPTGVLKNDGSAGGYTLLPAGTPVRLIDMEGYVVKEWNTGGGGDAKITKDGTLLRSSSCAPVEECDGNPLDWGGTQGRLREWDWNEKLIWDIDLAEEDWIQHHTFHRMDNGNTLILVWERYSRQEAIIKGRHPDTVNPEGTVGYDVRARGSYCGDLWPDAILEIAKCDPHKRDCYEIVWEWRAWDHLCNQQKKDCIDINYHIPRPTAENHRASADFMHANALDYLEQENLIVLNSRIFGESYLIDKGTGKIVFRWGNPSAWNKKAEPSSYMNDGDTQLWGPHGTHFHNYNSASRKVSLIIFDNGWLRPTGNLSRAVELEVDLDNLDSYLYVEPKWTFQTASANSLDSPFVSYAQRFGANTVITSGGEGHIIEVTPSGGPGVDRVVWEYVLPAGGQCVNIDGVSGGFMFRSYRYAADYVGLQQGGLSQLYRYPDCP